MKQQLYHYALSLKNRKLSNVSTTACWILLAMFLIPLTLLNIWLGVLILLSYFLLYFFSKKEADKYCKELISLGLFLLFLGLEFSALLLTQYNVIIFLAVTILILMIFYEALFFIKIEKKMYSRTMLNKSPWENVIPLIFGGTGFWCGKLIAKTQNTDLILWIGILLCSVLIVGSFSLFQKYFIYKIINK